MRAPRPSHIVLRTADGVRGWRQVHRKSPGIVPAIRYHHLVVNRGEPVTLRLDAGDSSLSAVWDTGTFALVPAGTASRWEWSGVAALSVSPLEILPQRYGSGRAAPSAGGGYRRLAPMAGVGHPAILALVDLLEEILADRSSEARQLAASLGRSLAMLLDRQQGAAAGSAGRMSPLRRAGIERWIERAVSEPLTVAQLAAVSGLSREAFSRAFRAEFGQAPKAYLTDRRLDKARRLLRETSATVAEIALECGFGSHSAFAAHFAAGNAVSPSAYRRRYR